MRSKNLVLAVVGIMLVGFLFMIFSPMLTTAPKSETIKTKTTPSATVPSAATEVPFTHEGHLWFISPAGDTLKKIELEIADNDFETQRGLMDRRSMGENRGMIFVFPNMEQRSFWMKNTFIPLDILFVKDNMEIESIQENTVPHSKQSVPSVGPAQYVVEVNAGFCQSYGITAGTKVVFERL